MSTLIGWSFLLFVGCAPPDGPQTAICDPNDSTLCLLPWPSSRFQRSNGSSPTGIRVEVDSQALGREQDCSQLNQADGFSRITPILSAFGADIAVPDGIWLDGPLRVYLAEPDHEKYGEPVPLAFHVVKEIDFRGTLKSLLVGYTQVVLEPGARYVAVVTDDLEVVDATVLAPSPETELILGLRRGENQSERQLASYHRATRDVLQDIGIRTDEVVRVWDFYTRSDASGALQEMRSQALAAVDDGGVVAVADSVTVVPNGPVLMTILGHLEGVPIFHEDGVMTTDSQGVPVATRTGNAPFRMVVPRTDADYPIVIYGHGGGGAYTDATFDRLITEMGAAKISMPFHGWGREETIRSMLALIDAVEQSGLSANLLLQSFADIGAMNRAIPGALTQMLEAQTIGGFPNPAAGRKPTSDPTIWIGHSLGATAGLTHVLSEPDIGYAVLSAGGLRWSQWMQHSIVWREYLEAVLGSGYGGDIGASHILAVTQTLWDPVDAALQWRDMRSAPLMALVMENLGDTFMPNFATSASAAMLGAVYVGEPIQAHLDAGWEIEVTGQTAMTQYSLANADEADLHDLIFGAHEAGTSAQEQIRDFFQSVWAGNPTITIPDGCATNTPSTQCNF